jgi:hypothetical protein
MLGRQKIALAVALAIPLAGFGLRPAMAGSNGVCGSLTRGPGACEQGGIDRSDLYQVAYDITAGASFTVTCKGGESLESRDTALHDNFTGYLNLAGIPITDVTDATGRLVGLSVAAGPSLGGQTLHQYLTCIDDR